MTRRGAAFSINGNQLRDARKAAGLTQRQLAAVASLHLNSVRRLEWFRDRRILRSSLQALRRCATHLPALPDYLATLSPLHLARGATTKEEGEHILLVTMGARAKPSHGQIEPATTAPVRQPAEIQRHPRKADRPKCGARTRKGSPCQAPSMPNGRCRMHGGLSTGARTEEGRQKIRDAQHRRWARYYARLGSPPVLTGEIREASGAPGSPTVF